MDDCVDLVGSSNFVSKFGQVALTKRACEVSAFVAPTDLYSYTVLPFGLTNGNL